MRKRILLAVTIDDSLQFLTGFPAFLVSKGWDVHVVSSPGPRLAELETIEGVTTHALEMRRDPSPLADIRALFGWVGILRRVRPAVVSVGTPKAGLLGAIGSKLTRTPVRVYILRGLRLESETGVRRRVLLGMERLASRSSHHMIAVSSSLRTRAIELKIADATQVSLISNGSSNGVDIDVFDSARFSAASRQSLFEDLGLQPGIPVIGFVGRLTQAKGLAVLSEALNDLILDDVPHQVLIVGGIDHNSGERLADALISAESHVTIVPKVRQPAIYYTLMDIFCLPTLREGFPNVVLEAAASGRAIVTTNATGAVDSVEDGVTGLLADVDSPENLSEKLAILCRDKSLRIRLGEQARKSVEQKYERYRFWQSHEEFYADYLEHSRRRSVGPNQMRNQ